MASTSWNKDGCQRYLFDNNNTLFSLKIFSMFFNKETTMFFVCQLPPRGHGIPTFDDYANITKCLNTYSYLLFSVM